MKSTWGLFEESTMAYHNMQTLMCIVLMVISCLNGLHGSDHKFFCPRDKDIGEIVLFFLHTNKNPDTYQQLYLGDVYALDGSNFNKHSQTKVVVHGFRADSHQLDGMEQTIKRAYLDNHDDYNIILVDWSQYSENCFYDWIVEHIGNVGQQVGKFVAFLIDNGLASSKVEIVGHSLGAHVAGLAGKYLQSVGKKIPRITGLDPARPSFINLPPSGRIAQGDAGFVEIIHSDGGCYGFDKKIGDADFYPNGGDKQPGCGSAESNRDELCYFREPREPLRWGSNLCAHSRSWRFFAESIYASHRFNAVKCEKIAKGETENCEEATSAQMGNFADQKLEGYFYLTTNSEPPYSKD